jgi:hypothetical protein
MTENLNPHSGGIKYQYFVDKVPYECEEAHLTGIQIKSRLPEDLRVKPLYLEGHGDPHPFLITEESRVSFDEGPKFFSTKVEEKWVYFVDGKEFEAKESSLTGADIRKNLTEEKRGYALYLEGLGNEPDQLVNDSTCISLEKHRQHRLYTVPPASFGRQ